jgi:hypothetical protein
VTKFRTQQISPSHPKWRIDFDRCELAAGRTLR